LLLNEYTILVSAEKVFREGGSRPKIAMKKNLWKPIIEAAFILFLFYANLLMGEFERSGMGRRRGLEWAITDIFTPGNFAIALGAAAIGYFLFEFLRKRF
jgi:hypothetical protein